jgi:hypothetical protein
MTQGMGKQIGNYYVVCGALKTTPGTFAPVFTVHQGRGTSGKIVHRQEFPISADVYVTTDGAFEAAAVLAEEWIAANT